MTTQKPLPQAAEEAISVVPDILPTEEVYCDAGHGYGKFISGHNRSVFPTLVASVQADLANFSSVKSARRPFVVEVDGQHYAIGEDALESRRNLRRRLDLSGLGGELHKVVLLAGLTQVVPGSAKIRLITQMPISWYGQRDKLFNLAGSHFVTYRNQRFCYTLDRKNMVVYPESFGTIVCYAFDQDGEQVEDFAGAKVAVVDVGTETTNIGMYEEGLRFIPQQSFTVSAGMSDVWEHIAGAINRDHGRKPALDDIDHALRDSKGIYMLGAKKIDLNEAGYLPAAVHAVAHTIILEIQNKLEGGTLGNYFIGGGGGWPYIDAEMRNTFGDQLLDPSNFAAAANIEPWLYNVTGLRRFEAFKKR